MKIPISTADVTLLKWLKLSKSTIFIWINALVMLTGLLFLHWSAEIVVVAYFFETIIIAVISLFKLFFTAIYTKEKPIIDERYRYLDLVAIPFFAFVYAFAIFIQSVFAFVFLKMNQPALTNPIDVGNNFMLYLSQSETLWIYGSIILMNAGTATTQFFVPRKFKAANLEHVAHEPFGRITIQQIMVIITGYLFLTFHFSSYIAIVFILVSFCVDLILVMKQEEKMKAQQLHEIPDLENKKGRRSI